MKKITDFIVEKRYLILIIFLTLAVISIFLSNKVSINYDMTKYLPSNSETKMGYDIMEHEFSSDDTSNLNVMFKDLSSKEKNNILEELKKIKGVDSVDYDDSGNYNKDNYTLYTINVNDKDDSKTSKEVYDAVTLKYEDYNIETSGSISQRNKPVLSIVIVIAAIAFAMFILIIMCPSYIEPFLFLFVIGIAVILNKGSNIMFSSVSNITNSIVAILQMALSMDYSIMLMNRYTQEKVVNPNKVVAMKEALYKSFLSISSSSITTIVGLLALVFMSFTIGRDLGFVLAKGVLFSLISIFFVLPSLILMFDKLILKTRKKIFNPDLSWMGKFSYKMRHVMPLLFILIFIGSFLLKGNLGYSYTGAEVDEVSKVFKENNQMAIIYNNDYEDEVAKYCKSLETVSEVDSVLCYGNTINEKLTYDKLSEKLKSFSNDINVDDYLLKILYFNYYNNDKVTMTFNEFVTFLEENVFKNSTISEKLDGSVKNNISILKYFTTSDEINKLRNKNEISEILGIDEDSIDDLLVYYNSKNIDNKLTIKEFVNFLNNDVLTNEKYSSNIDDNSRNKIKTLSKFIDSNIINKNMSSSEMSNLFSIDKSLVDSLYTYYVISSDVNIELTTYEFSSFILNNLVNNPSYSNMFSDDVIKSVETLNTFSQDTVFNDLDYNTLSNMFGIDEGSVKQLLFLKYSNLDSNIKLSIKDFINNIYSIKNNTNYLDNNSNLDSLINLHDLANNKDGINTLSLNKDGLKMVFDNISNGLVDNVYNTLNLSDSTEFTTIDFLDITLNNIGQYLSSDEVNKLSLIKFVMSESISSNPGVFTSTEISQLLGVDVSDMNRVYALIKLVNNSIYDWTASPYEFVSIILNNQESLSGMIDSGTIAKLNMLKNIMDNIDTKFNCENMSQVVGMDGDTIKNIYSLYKYNTSETKLSPYNFVKFILNHKNDSMLSSRLNNSIISELSLVKNIMDGVINNTKYDSNSLAQMFSMNNDDISLLYSLYAYKNSEIDKSISLIDLVNFIVSDVLTNEKYNREFDDKSKNSIITINNVMSSSLKNYKYTKSELVTILSVFTSSINEDQIDLLYTYYGSENKYNYDWKLTITEFVNYLNDDIVDDYRFKDFIPDDMKNNIINAKKTVSDAHDMLVGKKYSRVVVNTKLDSEGNKTFNFIKKIKNNLNKSGVEYYIIGDSPMAYEMNQTFDGELNLITILTMILIFLVVAISFKSLSIPTILVLIIQCAVFITMGILSLLGGDVYFISILIVQSILMGATIDYAILYTSYYKESRSSMDIRTSLINSYSKASHTILTSASILIIVTLVVGFFASDIAAKICRTISEGTLASTILILFVLPSIVAAFDKLIYKNK